jgi:hypothetical protein
MLSQKQKNKLIRDLEAASTTAIPKKLRKKAQTVSLNIVDNRPVQSSRRKQKPVSVSMRGTVGPAQRGISNVLGQRTDIPLKQPFVGSESLGRFNGSIGFTETQFPINPGQAGTFPWLSQEAKLWEKYEFDKLEFEFRTTINEFSANALGRVILGVDFDASDPAPSNRSQAEISRPVTAQAPYYNQRLVLRKEDMGEVCKYHYVRPGVLPGQSDIKFYDVGVLNFGTDGNINANEVGELWVHYAGTFKNQILESTTTAPSNFSVAQFSQSGAAITSGVSTNLPLATQDANGIQAVNTAGSIVLPPGNYLADVVVRLDAATNLSLSAVTFRKNGAGVGVAAQTAIAPASLMTSTTLSISAFVTSNGTDALTVNVVGTFVGAGSTYATLRLTSI